MVTSARAGTAPKKRIRTGVAISTTAVCAADLRLRGSTDRSWRASLDAPPADGGSWPSLANALVELARTLGVAEGGGTLDVALMPPLTEVRRLDVPPLRDDELRRLLARNASKYFVNARGAQIVGVSAVGKRARNSPRTVVATAASARLLDAIHAAARHAGWQIATIAPAESAWASASLAVWPSLAKQSASVIVATEDRSDLLQMEAGRLAGVRRFRAGGGDASMVLDSAGPSTRVFVVGAMTQRRELGAALSSLGLTPTLPSGELAPIAERADLLAAHFASSVAGPDLRAEDAVVVEKARARKTAWIVAGAAAALLVLAAGIELWGVHHQLDVVRAERAKIRPQIATTMVGRTTVEVAYKHLAALTAAERDAPQWSSVFTALSEAVPEEAYLTAVRARQDTVVIDGLAEHAARVFDALAQTPGFVDVKAASPVRRELQDDGTALEHFVIAARVSQPPSTTMTAAVSPRRPGQ